MGTISTKTGAGITEDVLRTIRENGYEMPKEVPGNGVCVIAQFAYTWAVMTDLSAMDYGRRYCFEHKDDAVASLLSWEGTGHTPGPWIKCKGDGIDLLNPNL